jgi:tetratricopeptide (TPR) repeat protein
LVRLQKLRALQRKQLVAEMESRDNTFNPAINKNSTRIVERLKSAGYRFIYPALTAPAARVDEQDARDRRGVVDAAIEAYNRFIAMEYYSWEYYDSLCSLARCHHEMKDEAAVGKVLAEAIRFDSTRGEAFVALGDMHYEQQRWAMAAPFYRAAIGLQAPVEGFSLPHVYTWLPKDRLAVCYGHLGMVKEASELTLEILSSCPETDRLLANLRMYGDALRRSSQP